MLIWILLSDGEHYTDTPNDSSALSSGSVWPVRVSHTELEGFSEKNFGCNLSRLCCKEKSIFPLKLTVLYSTSKKLELSPLSLMIPDKYPVFPLCVSCSPQHRAETTWHRTQCVWWIGRHTAALTPFAMYFMKWTSGSEINRPPWWMRTTLLGPYQEPSANLWQAKPAPSLDTPLVFEIKVDACNPGKWSLYSRLTPV